MLGSHELIIALVGLYFVIITFSAQCFSRKISGLKDFFLANQSLGAWPVAFTFAATWFGAASTIATVNQVNHEGLNGLWPLVFPSILSFVVITLFFARQVARFSRNGMLSQPQAVEAAYGQWGRFMLSLTILGAVSTFIGSQLVAVGQIYQTLLGWDFGTTVWIMAGLVVTYTMLGGYYAVVVTDVIYIGFIVAGLLLLTLFCGQHVLSHSAALTAPFTQAAFWHITPTADRLFLLVTFVLGWSIAPEMWQRMSSLKNEHQALKASLLATGIIGGLFVLVISIGILSTALLPHSDAVLVDLALKMPSPVLTAVILAAVTSAIASTMDSSINVGSLTLTHDLYRRFVRPKATNHELLWVSRLSTVVMVIPGILLAIRFQDIIRVLWISADIYTSMMFIPIVGILYLKAPKPLAGILAMVGGGTGVLLSALNQYGWLSLAGWPVWPASTMLGVVLSAMGFGLGQWALSGKRKTLVQN